VAKSKNGSRATAQAETPTGQAQQKGSRPAKEFRLGRVRASCWLNTNSKGESWFSIVLTRSYKDAQGNWKNSHSLGLDDLFVAGEVLKQAALWVYAERQGEHKVPAVNGEAPAAEEVPPIPF
jgi:hypothetical protein